jgi:ACS family hexuronate transporter-like MFS transporter
LTTANANTLDKSQVKGSGNYRWVIIGLAFFITLVNYLDRSAISFAITPIKQEFGIDDSAFGFIGGAFGMGYIFMTLGGGILVDKFGPRKVWAFAAMAWSTITACLGLAHSIQPLLVMRVSLGLAEGPHFPSLTRVVSDWLPPAERARATALGLAAVPFSSVIGAPLISQLIIHLGWRVMFAVLGSMGILWSAAWLFFFSNFPEKNRFVSDSELNIIRIGISERNQEDSALRVAAADGKNPSTWKRLLTNPTLLANYYAFFAFGYTLFFSVNWLPGYLERAHGLKLSAVGMDLVYPWLTATVLLCTGGLISDAIWKKTGSIRKARSHVIWVCQLLSALSFIPLLFHPTLTEALISMSLGVGLGLMPNACFYAINCDLAKDKAGTSQGLMTCASATSSIAAPILTGWLVSATGNFSAAFGLLIFFSLTSVAAVIFLHQPDRDLHID